MDPITARLLFALSLFIGLMLIGAEIFVPGGVLGTFGAIALLAASILGFMAFGAANGIYVALGIVALLGVSIILWIKIFPRTGVGRQMSVLSDLGKSKGTEDGLGALLHVEGEALSDLRPAGFALLEGRRVDVVTTGRMLDKGARVRVVEVEGNRVVVTQV